MNILLILLFPVLFVLKVLVTIVVEFGVTIWYIPQLLALAFKSKD